MEEQRPRLNLIPLLVGACVIVGTLVANCREGPFGRRQLVSMTRQQEAAMGAQAFQEVLSQSAVVPDGPAVEVVRRIGKRLAAASQNPEFLKATHIRPANFDWEFRVVREQQVNAFCLPGGKVVVYTGILPVCQNEAALAAVMGHEIGHALASHGAERMAQQQVMQVGQQAVSASLGDYSPQDRQKVLAVLSAGANVGYLLPYSRKHESEADRLGLYLMAIAGYDPSEAIEFWGRMGKAGGSRPPEILSTHPEPGRRAAQLREWLPQVEPFYERSDKQRARPLPLD